MANERAVSTEVPTQYGLQVGERLRVIRRQKRLSLQDVEAASSQEFKASVLGAYERGERAISVPRLQRLARFYAVPVDQLLPADRGPAFAAASATARAQQGDAVTIDLDKLEELDGPEAEMLGRYLSTIQIMRQDFTSREITIRRDDLRSIAAILGSPLDQAVERLEELGLRVAP